MNTIFREVKSIEADERRVYESVVGHPLGDDQCVVIRVIERRDWRAASSGLPAEDWAEKNKRRRFLIDKQIEGTLLPDEWFELDELQRQAAAMRDQMAPLPMAGARKLHEELLKEKRRSEAKE